VKALRIVVMSVVAAILYGIAHDQITARICVEYFTIGHPDLFGTDSPTLLGLGWGILATWWAGLILGIPLAMAARLGSRLRVEPVALLGPIAKLLGVMAVCAVASGVFAFVAGSMGRLELPAEYAADLPDGKALPFLVDLWTHNASYLVGFAGGLVVCISTWIGRRKAVAPEPTGLG
jgi:hypothetical protein